MRRKRTRASRCLRSLCAASWDTQPALVESIRATLREVRGAQPSDREIAEMFAAEARDESVEHYDCDDDSADSDYRSDDDRYTFLFQRDRAGIVLVFRRFRVLSGA